VKKVETQETTTTTIIRVKNKRTRLNGRVFLITKTQLLTFISTSFSSKIANLTHWLLNNITFTERHAGNLSS
jgi:hypothetical protein